MKAFIRKIIKNINNFINNLQISMNRVVIGKDSNFNGIFYLKNLGTISIGNEFKLTSGARYNPIGGDVHSKLYCAKGATLSIGNNVGISNSAIFVTTSVNIEDNVMIGGGCKIWDTDFHSINHIDRIQKGDSNIISKPIIIKKNAFIGAGSFILKGACIGENSVIGAASVVTKNIPDNEVWAGNPARKIRSI
ncbi:DapH/DapD/GlmU-related protein [Vibrio breoganii]|uniref:acyltransferase n=1 Tax=Vibrio breoganii TaxID=553239 RepID=UPI0014822E60|nr:acyltransferase [Vibrio breoganii]